MKKNNLLFSLMCFLMVSKDALSMEDEACEHYRQKLMAAAIDTQRIQPSALDSLMLKACDLVNNKPFIDSLKPMAIIKAYDPEVARETRARRASEAAWDKAMRESSSYPEAHLESAYAYYFEKFKKE